MTANKIVILLITIVMSVTTAASAQSLADIAREQRQKQPAKDTAPPRKVITNDDLPEDRRRRTYPMNRNRHAIGKSFPGGRPTIAHPSRPTRQAIPAQPTA